ncbi:MAG TPA: hypothetical protein VMU19_14690 [Bryobacteraceae bacterium]|nr:hypothetical protein [Bryobacteraceae bacterium]
MRNFIAILALLALPLAAQEQQQKEEPKGPQVQRLFVLKYADPNQVNNLIRVFTSNTNPNAAMHAIAVSASPEAMAAIEDAIGRLDVPASAPKNIELTAYLLTGTDSDAGGAALPKELDSVVTQLKSAFAYKAYKLGDVLTLRGRTGQRLDTSDSGGAVTAGGQSQPIYTQFTINALSVGVDGAIHVDGLKLQSRVPVAGTFTGNGGVVNTQFNYQQLGINTDLDIKEGQKVVVGKMSMSQNEAMFLVLTARIAQ